MRITGGKSSNESVCAPAVTRRDVRLGERPLAAAQVADDAEEVMKDVSRLGAACKCGRTINMPVTALGMRVACSHCGEKTRLTRENTISIRRITYGRGTGDSGGCRATRLENTQGKRIGQLLIDAGLVDRKQISEALAVQAAQGGKIVEILIALGCLNQTEFTDFLARHHGIASIGLSDYDVPLKIASIIPREYAIEHEVIPLDRMGGLLTVAMVCPLDHETVRELESGTGLQVKPFLCSRKDFKLSLRRYYRHDGHSSETESIGLNPVPFLKSRGASVRIPGTAEIVRSIDSLPLLPGTVSLVQKFIEEESTSVSALFDVVSSDPSATIQVLREANLDKYGLSRRVSTIQRAISLLGCFRVTTLLLESAGNVPLKEWREFDYQTYWTHALSCAIGARTICRACPDVDEDVAFTAGLLHDIGRLVLAETTSEDSYPMSYAEAGYLLGSAWGLPDEITQSMLRHGDFADARAVSGIDSAVAIARSLTLANDDGYPSNADLFMEHPKALSKLGMTNARAASILEDFRSTLIETLVAI